MNNEEMTLKECIEVLQQESDWFDNKTGATMPDVMMLDEAIKRAVAIMSLFV